MKQTRTKSETLEKTRPALTPEARENQLISLAVDLVEERLRNGTASSSETTHFLKLASRKSQTEGDMLELQKELLKAKTDAIRAQQRTEELYANALAAMKKYSGQEDYEEYYE